MFEPCEIRIDETRKIWNTLRGKIISYSIPNESIIKILVMVIQILMTYRNEDYDKLYISFLIGDGTDCTDEVSIKNHYKKYTSKCRILNLKVNVIKNIFYF